MAFGNNLVGKQTRAFFQVAGGVVMKFRHPYLAGAIAGSNGNIDEIDVSNCVKLDETFLKATPNQDSSSQTVMVDGSTVVVTNTMLNGTLEVPAVRTSGTVAEGDLIAALQLIKAAGDNVGGTFTVTEFSNGKAITTLYYGVSVKNVPDKILMGLQVPTYPVQLFYSGWVQAVTTSANLNTRAIWAAGSLQGVSGVYTPFGIQEGSTLSAAPTIDNITGGGSSQIPTAEEVNAGASDNTVNTVEAVGTNYGFVSGTTLS